MIEQDLEARHNVQVQNNSLVLAATYNCEIDGYSVTAREFHSCSKKAGTFCTHTQVFLVRNSSEYEPSDNKRNPTIAKSDYDKEYLRLTENQYHREKPNKFRALPKKPTFYPVLKSQRKKRGIKNERWIQIPIILGIVNLIGYLLITTYFKTDSVPELFLTASSLSNTVVKG